MRQQLALIPLFSVVGCGRARFERSDAGPPMDAAEDVGSPLDGSLDAPGFDAPGFDAPGPGSDAPGSDAPGFDAPGFDAPGFDAPGSDAPGSDAPSTPDAFASDVGVDAPSPDAAMPDAGSTCGDLRLYYRFEEASGPVVDSSGCGNDGLANAVATGEPGRVGSAYLFQRTGVTNAHVLVADSPSLSALTGLTVEAWVRHTGGNFQAIVDQGDLMGGDPFVLHTYSSRDPAITMGNHPTCIGGASHPTSVTLPLNAWVHVAVTLDTTADLLVFYLDGVEIHREGSSLPVGPLCDNAEAMLVGAARPDGTWGWQGWIDELRIWGVVRSAAEICTDAGGTSELGGCALP